MEKKNVVRQSFAGWRTIKFPKFNIYNHFKKVYLSSYRALQSSYIGIYLACYVQQLLDWSAMNAHQIYIIDIITVFAWRGGHGCNQLYVYAACARLVHKHACVCLCEKETVHLAYYIFFLFENGHHLVDSL